MNEEKVRTNRGEAESANTNQQERDGGPEIESCCGTMMADMMRDCPCGSFLKKHWAIAFAIFSLVILAFLISQIGGILGIIAFFRTL